MSDNAAMWKDAFWMLCGREIGHGVARKVYVCDALVDCVVKVEETSGSFQNIVEWETWNRVKGTDFERWFAPCHNISPNGSILVQHRTRPLNAYPEKMPAFLTDFKRQNYGLYKGQIVCHDYGTHLLFENGMTKRMRKVKWWDPHDEESK